MTDKSLERQLRASLQEAQAEAYVPQPSAQIVPLHTAPPVRRTADPKLVERVAISGDLAKLSSQERVNYYGAVCESLGLNPLTRPFDYLQLNGKLILYANKGCTDQLRSIQSVSVEIVKREYDSELGIYTVTARATKPSGRADEDVGSVQCRNLQGDALANATMKAHTKAKRRVTLSICGLSFLDESEIDSIPNAQRVEGELPRISPHGELEAGKVYRSEEEEDRAILAIQDAESMADLKEALHSLAWESPAELENWSPESRKRISAAYRRRERQLGKPKEVTVDPDTGEVT